eukprot:CAMPEP_0202508022 /NCGR_PEP_ID=MMETSP1361-20130828/52034_1 /ASSEMBLY_ACC=CAM_ASM_000849 /TAXON_ID=210615 /ORGANISM="Staurosira complex sp., Strain CCMP2646" /LENGTH=48 /DNA_ID= /DNA_START= /DNA_END= /DNA_ORIENTATION=
MSKKALKSRNDYLRQVNDGTGNFRMNVATGDLEPTRYLTKHAKLQIME